MTREDIEKLNAFEPYSFETDREEQWYQVGLKQGLKVADEHPKFPWLSAKYSLPYQHEELVCSVMKSSDGTVYGLTKQVLVLGKDKTLNIALMINKGFGWEWDRLYTDIEYWMPIPELPKE